MKRRTFLATTALGLVGCRTGRAQQCVLTAADIEGPFFRPGAPSRASMGAATLDLHGVVMDRRCQPIPGAQIELWQADAEGRYDLEGFRFRSRLETAADGRWSVRTIVPGRYLNGATYRPAHIHAKVHAGDRHLTTQLYFPGDPFNENDPWFDASRLVQMDGGRARFDFVL